MALRWVIVKWLEAGREAARSSGNEQVTGKEGKWEGEGGA
jgi:hypothetical protein